MPSWLHKLRGQTEANALEAEIVAKSADLAAAASSEAEAISRRSDLLINGDIEALTTLDADIDRYGVAQESLRAQLSAMQIRLREIRTARNKAEIEKLVRQLKPLIGEHVAAAQAPIRTLTQIADLRAKIGDLGGQVELCYLDLPPAMFVDLGAMQGPSGRVQSPGHLYAWEGEISRSINSILGETQS